ncbi:unnamed protein product, partial [Phaeothamnion confervicola]
MADHPVGNGNAGDERQEIGEGFALFAERRHGGAPSRSFAGREPGPDEGVTRGHLQEIPKMLIARRAALKFTLTAVPAACVSTVFVSSAHAVDALPAARFVGWAQNFNDYEIAAGRMALAKSGNE